MDRGKEGRRHLPAHIGQRAAPVESGPAGTEPLGASTRPAGCPGAQPPCGQSSKSDDHPSRLVKLQRPTQTAPVGLGGSRSLSPLGASSLSPVAWGRPIHHGNGSSGPSPPNPEEDNTLQSPKRGLACMCMLIRVQLFVTPWTVAHQALLSVQFFRQEYWSQLPCPSPGDLPDPGIKPTSPVSPALAAGFLTTMPPGKP